MDEQKRYRFCDTDLTGTEEYDIAGDDYIELIDTCCKYCKVVSFKVENEDDTFLDSYNQFLIRKEEIRTKDIFFDNIEKIRYYDITKEICGMLKSISNSVFSWLYGLINLEDLAFYREDGSLFFNSITHDGICNLFPKEGENISNIISKGHWEQNPPLPIFDFTKPTQSFEEIIRNRKNHKY